jgi:predicted amidohydrolase
MLSSLCAKRSQLPPGERALRTSVSAPHRFSLALRHPAGQRRDRRGRSERRRDHGSVSLPPTLARVRVAICQMSSGRGEIDENIAVAERLLREAADGAADLAALPEVFPFYGSASRSREIAEPVPGPVTDRLTAIARERGMWILGGSLAERDGDHVFNTSTLFDRTGELVSRYRKIHLFDVDLPGQPPLRESALYSAGDQLVTHETEFARVGLSICYDLRFPELYRGLMAVGAEVLLVPSAFTAHTGEAHWEVLLRARAIENQCFVVAPAQWGPWGPPEDGRRCYGNSLVVDPWGRVLARAPDEGDGVWFAELDMTELQRIRQSLPALQHRALGLTC